VISRVSLAITDNEAWKIKTQTDDLLSVEVQTNEADEKKRELSEQQETGSKCKKAFTHLTMDEFLAGEDSEDDDNGEVNYTMHSDHILKAFFRSCTPVNPPLHP